MFSIFIHYCSRIYHDLYRFKNAFVGDLVELYRIYRYYLFHRKELKTFSKHESLLIVARYNENIDWLKEVDIPCLIFNKGKKDIHGFDHIINLPNIGRETHTYLHFILKAFHHLPKQLIFCQGDPFEHAPDLIRDLKLRKDFLAVQPLSIRYVAKHYELLKGHPTYHTGVPPEEHVREDMSHHRGINYYIEKIDNGFDAVEPRYRPDPFIGRYKYSLKHQGRILEQIQKTIGLEVSTPIFSSYAAIFAVDSSVIKKRPLKFYKTALKFVLKYKESGPVYFERLWMQIFPYVHPGNTDN